jgi:hypothetical protein
MKIRDVVQVIHRQADPIFTTMLNEIRRGKVTQSTTNILKECEVRHKKNQAERDGA